MATNVLELLLQPWAIQPAMLEEYQSIYRAHVAGEETPWLRAVRTGEQ